MKKKDNSIDAKQKSSTQENNQELSSEETEFRKEVKNISSQMSTIQASAGEGALRISKKSADDE